MRLTDRASAAATWPLGHYLTFLSPEAPSAAALVRQQPIEELVLTRLLRRTHSYLDRALRQMGVRYRGAIVLVPGSSSRMAISNGSMPMSRNSPASSSW